MYYAWVKNYLHKYDMHELLKPSGAESEILEELPR